MTEIIVERTGECLKCGVCCFENRCPHFNAAERSCDIYDTRDKFCETCKRDHAVCIAWPVYPVIFAKPFCGYRFKVRGTELEVIRMETVKRE